MDLIIDNMSGSGMVDGVNCFIIAVVFVAVEILGLTTMTYSNVNYQNKPAL